MDGRPNHRNKAALSNSSSDVYLVSVVRALNVVSLFAMLLFRTKEKLNGKRKNEGTRGRELGVQAGS